MKSRVISYIQHYVPILVLVVVLSVLGQVKDPSALLFLLLLIGPLFAVCSSEVFHLHRKHTRWKRISPRRLANNLRLFSFGKNYEEE